jgi:hypothetical protein
VETSGRDGLRQLAVNVCSHQAALIARQTGDSRLQERGSSAPSQ